MTENAKRIAIKSSALFSEVKIERIYKTDFEHNDEE